MKYKKIIFILATQDNTNNIKRIDEFVENGYQVEAYSFFRGSEVKNKPKTVEIQNIGQFTNDLPYKKRFGIMRKGIKYVLDKTKKDDCVYYLIRQDIAMIYVFLCNRPYIYEEADMTHVTFGNKFVRGAFELLDKYIIKKSVLSVFRSEGFILYHYGDKRPNNIYVIPNRLDKSILSLASKNKVLDTNHIRFGFVGVIRYETIHHFAEIILKNFPQHEVHYYGINGTQKDEVATDHLKLYKNFYFHGKFSNPVDLPSIYENIDIVLSAYDLSAVNHKYAEPNKYYESIYFQTPIVVSDGGFLAKKVKELGVGYAIDVKDDEGLKSFVSGLTEWDIHEKMAAAKSIDQSYCINENKEYFELLKSAFNKL